MRTPKQVLNNKLSKSLTALIAVVVLGSTPALFAGWRQYGFDASHSSFNPAETQLSRANVATLTLRWSGETGGKACSPPIIGASRVFVGAHGLLHAFAAGDGLALWSTSSCGGTGRERMALGKYLFVADDDFGDFGTFHPGTGDVIRCDDGGIVVAPSLDDDALYLPLGELAAETQSTGTVRWLFEPPPVAGIRGAPAIANGVVFATGDNFVFALHAATGRQIWDRPLSHQSNLSSASVANGIVYVGGNGLFALSAADGHILWNVASAGTHVTMPAVVKGKVFVNSQGSNPGLAAFDAATGALLWRNQMTGESSATASVANGVVYEIAATGQLMMFNADTGAFLASLVDPDGRPFDSGFESYASVTNGMVYVPTADPNLKNRVDAFGLP